MAMEAAGHALREAGIAASDLSLILCSTSTPTMISPSTACQVLKRLAPESDVTAYDIQAACSGYLYALASAWDFLQSHPHAHVLVLTTETMRRIVNIDDPDTSPIFGDAATATVLTTASAHRAHLATLCRPVLGASGEDGTTLRVPLPQQGGYVKMDGRKVFAEAIRHMRASLEKACAASNLALADLDLIVPHQANGRIIEAIRARLGLPIDRVWNEIRFQGNTSSSSIPLALDTVLRQKPEARHIGLCAFGAGYTFGGAILKVG
jgi:2-oxoisovalerate dehydrogenase E1 component